MPYATNGGIGGTSTCWVLTSHPRHAARHVHRFVQGCRTLECNYAPLGLDGDAVPACLGIGGKRHLHPGGQGPVRHQLLPRGRRSHVRALENPGDELNASIER